MIYIYTLGNFNAEDIYLADVENSGYAIVSHVHGILRSGCFTPLVSMLMWTVLLSTTRWLPTPFKGPRLHLKDHQWFVMPLVSWKDVFKFKWYLTPTESTNQWLHQIHRSKQKTPHYLIFWSTEQLSAMPEGKNLECLGGVSVLGCNEHLCCMHDKGELWYSGPSFSLSTRKKNLSSYCFKLSVIYGWHSLMTQHAL